MKKVYNTPKLTVHGSVEQLTEKVFGKDDGVVLTVPGIGTGPIGS